MVCEVITCFLNSQSHLQVNSVASSLQNYTTRRGKEDAEEEAGECWESPPNKPAGACRSLQEPALGANNGSD